MTRPRKPSRRLTWRWGIAVAALLGAAALYRHVAAPERLRAAALEQVQRRWKGDLSLGGAHFTPWGGLLLEDLHLATEGHGGLDIPRLRIRFSPARGLIGKSMVSDLEIDGATLALPGKRLDGKSPLADWPLASPGGNDGNLRGNLLVTLSNSRVTLGGSDEMKLPLVAVRCEYLRSAGATDVTGEIKGSAWSSGSFRVSYGKGVCRWDGALHGMGLTTECRQMLWPQARSVWDLFAPSGTVELTGRGTLSPREIPSSTFTLSIATQDAGVTYRPFPLPYRNVHGVLSFDETGRMDLKDFWGYGAGALTTCEGAAQLKGDHRYVDLDFAVQDLPLVPMVLNALPQGLRSAWEWSGAEGRLSGRLRLFHAPVLPEPLCFTASWSTDNLSLGNLPLHPMIQRGRTELAGRLTGGRPSDVTGTVQVERGELSGRVLTGLKGRFSWDGPRLELDLQEGSYAGGTVNGRMLREWKEGDFANTVTLDLADAMIEHMKRGTLLADQAIHGALSAHIDLGWRGSDAKTLTGKGEASIQDGYLFSLPPLSAPLAVLSLNIGQRDPVIRTGRMLFHLDAETLGIDVLELPSDQVTVRAHGTLRKDGAVDLRVIANPGGPGVLRKIPVLKETAEGLRRFLNWVQERGLYVFRVKGPYRDPKVERVALFGLANKDVVLYRNILEGKPQPEAGE